MGGREGRLEAQGEQLLQNLINREQSLAASIEEARKEADSLVKQAQEEAAGLMDKARAAADAAEAELRSKAEAEAARVREETIAAARADAEAIAKRAEGGSSKAVELVMERILP